MSLKLIIGPMYAGKSTELVRDKRKISSEFPSCGILVINHTLDNRYTSSNFVTTHDKETEVCTKTNNLSSLVYMEEFKNASHIFIDEGQFFEKNDILRFVKDCMYMYSKNVTIAGLVSGVNMSDLGGLSLLMKYANEISILRGDCFYCDGGNSHSTMLEGVPNSFSMGDTINMDKLNDYKFISVCKKCWYDRVE